MNTIHKFGWIPDAPDLRDKHFRTTAPCVPQDVDLEPECEPVLNQEHLGACVPHGVRGCIAYAIRKHGGQTAAPSRLFIYWNARARIGRIFQDCGCRVRDAAKSVNVEGAPPETLWPYVPRKFKKMPPLKVYAEGRKWQTIEYERVQPCDIDTVLQLGYPVVFGATLYSSFNHVGRDGLVSMPDLRSETIIGAHCQYVIGRKDKCFKVRNSWGEAWGDRGNCWMPEAYLWGNLCSDMWVIRLSETGE